MIQSEKCSIMVEECHVILQQGEAKSCLDQAEDGSFFRQTDHVFGLEIIGLLQRSDQLT